MIIHDLDDVCYPTQRTYIWGLPKIGVPLSHPFLFGIFHYKLSSYWGSPMGSIETSITAWLHGLWNAIAMQVPIAHGHQRTRVATS
jgi:hypothetical protein